MPTILERIAEIEAEVMFTAATGYKSGYTRVVFDNLCCNMQEMRAYVQFRLSYIIARS